MGLEVGYGEVRVEVRGGFKLVLTLTADDEDEEDEGGFVEFIDEMRGDGGILYLYDGFF
jgi:hypothetical protein